MGRVSNARERLLTAITDLMWEHSYGAATVDAICSKAEVKKGSFYYFFESKSDLAVAALSHHWQSAKQNIESAFDESVPPVERFLNYFRLIYQEQQQCIVQKKRTLGCPYMTVGSEICCQDERIEALVRDILDELYRHFERSVHDVAKAYPGAVIDVECIARCLFNLFEGALAQVRINDELAYLKPLPYGIVQLLGVREQITATELDLYIAA
ncbi:MAG: TetR/AcrR family transcriptional regulator [Xanthomonadales bacterium]|jgi:TetR/AcrR family transcriptional repressor of nem operon|nr:TetR/AcrR family transcriptional regulator [Xanthomonadales bacterium]